MILRLTLAVFALVIAAPLSAQGDWRIRVDHAAGPTRPDAVPTIDFAAVEGGFQLSTGPAVVLWQDADTVRAPFTTSGTFTLLEPSSHASYYGIVYGAVRLQNVRQSYLYFLIAQNGTYVIKHRAEERVTEIVGRTEHPAIVRPGRDGRSVNELEVRAGATDLEFVVNGTVVSTLPRRGLTARAAGSYGVRVNHVIPGLLVEKLGRSYPKDDPRGNQPPAM